MGSIYLTTKEYKWASRSLSNTSHFVKIFLNVHDLVSLDSSDSVTLGSGSSLILEGRYWTTVGLLVTG